MSESGSIIEITSAAIKLAKKTMHYRIATRAIVFLDPLSQYAVLISVYYPNSQMSIGARVPAMVQGQGRIVIPYSDFWRIIAHIDAMTLHMEGKFLIVQCKGTSAKIPFYIRKNYLKYREAQTIDL